MKIDDRYLGDGVYARWDGHQIILDLRGQDSTTRIALVPSVMVSLSEYFDHIKAEYAKGKTG